MIVSIGLKGVIWVGCKSCPDTPLLLNLDADEGEGKYLEITEEHHSGLTEKEEFCYQELRSHLKQCQLCGSEVECKVDRLGHHTRLNFGQLQAWAVSLVCHKPYFPLCMT